MAGGLFLCFEGVEKLAHAFLHASGTPLSMRKAQRWPIQPLIWSPMNSLALKGAIRTDFILSAEIITIALGTVAAATFMEKLIVLAIIAVVITAGVYGLVAGIVKLDDGALPEPHQ